jgi:hypothetical protein
VWRMLAYFAPGAWNALGATFIQRQSWLWNIYLCHRDPLGHRASWLVDNRRF